MPLFDLASTSTAPLYGASSDLSRVMALWQEEYRLARRVDDPLTAVFTATLSTAAMWRLIK
jgi:hypothetical protein